MRTPGVDDEFCAVDDDDNDGDCDAQDAESDAVASKDRMYTPSRDVAAGDMRALFLCALPLLAATVATCSVRALRSIDLRKIPQRECPFFYAF